MKKYIVGILLMLILVFLTGCIEGPYNEKSVGETQTVKMAGLFSEYRIDSDNVTTCNIGTSWYRIRNFPINQINDLLGKYIEFTLGRTWQGAADYSYTYINFRILN